ncbi:hypothetical protein [Streptomyces sp. NPDC089919]|uniref:NADase-type glycan-binding domain-containing protein n=1 Tax=Streptomyces sp. NPDC089919 TaxID=3155188 RepID=UPI003433B00D
MPLLVVAVLAGAGYGLRSHASDAVEAVRDRIGKAEQVHPARVRASSSQSGHPAALVVDGTTDRYWAPAEAGPAAGAFLDLDFAGPVRLLDVVVHPGVSAVPEQFLTQGRPAELAVTLTDEDGGTTVKTLRVPDEPGPHRFRLGVSDVVRVRVTVRAAYAATPPRHLALAELEFSKRR